MTYPPPGPGTGPDPSGYGRQQPQYPDQGSPWARPSQPGGYPDDPASGVPGGYPNQPASGIPGYPQQPTSGFPGGYPGTPMSGVPMSGTPMSGVPVPQQPKSHAALITSLALGFVGLLGLGVVLYFVVGDDEDNTEPRADASATSDEPTDPEPGDTETEETTTGEKLSYTEYADDWEFQLDDVELDATYVNGWDYDGCAEFEADAAFTDLGCEYGVELAYEAEEGDLIVSHLIMGMTDADHAADAVDAFTDADFWPRDESFVADFETGRWENDSVGEFLVITLATSTSDVDEDTLDEYLSNKHWDMTAALEFRV